MQSWTRTHHHVAWHLPLCLLIRSLSGSLGANYNGINDQPFVQVEGEWTRRSVRWVVVKCPGALPTAGGGHT